MTGDLFNVSYARVFYFPAIRLLQRERNRMAGVTFRIGRHFQKLFFPNAAGHNLLHLEHALGQRARLIEYDDLGLRQRLKIVATLDKHAASGRAADSSKEA
ncbi:hypothetical protein SDC9_170128 [bioreactor metagenome]|uniref:Uncharacterized protein n=1 Tax=bioreactor metagenome TaxID=1076179 RepID=A0A645G7Z0_9ZZZZ